VAPLAEAASPSEALAYLVRLQGSDGSFAASAALASVLRVPLAALLAAKPADVADDAVWATAVALELLQVRFAEFEAEWSLLQRKSQRFLTRGAGPAAQAVRDAARAYIAALA